MGNGMSRHEMDEQIEGVLAEAERRTAKLITSKHAEDCPDLRLVKRSSGRRYDRINMLEDFDIRDVQSLSDAETKKLCQLVRTSEERKIALMKTVMESLRSFRSTLELMLDGGYCAVKEIAMGGTDSTFRVERSIDGDDSRAADRICRRRIAEHVRPSVSSDTSLDRVYDMNVRENASWKAMVDGLKATFLSCYRKNEKCLRRLGTDEIFPPENLDEIAKAVDEVKAEMRDGLKAFMLGLFESPDIRPLSLEEVQRLRTSDDIRRNLLREQKKASKKVVEELTDNMKRESKDLWVNSSSAAPVIYANNNFAKAS